MEIFAEGICFYKLFWVFIIGSIFGAYYEEILSMIENYKKYKVLMWEPRRGVFYGPISPVYGLGATMMTIVLIRYQQNLMITFLLASLLGGIVEYLISFLQEKFVGTVSWDYKNYFLNINGRTTIPYMAFWGFLGLCFIKYIYPLMSKFIESFSYDTAERITILFLIIIIIDCFITWTALARQNSRKNNKKPITKLGEIYDNIYNDKYIKKKFPNMKET